MSEINIIPKPTYQKIEPGYTNLSSIEKIITQTSNVSEMEVAKMVQKLHSMIQRENFDLSVAEYLVLNPQFRGIIRRIQSLEKYPFAEVQDNILSKETMPINMLRVKLSFFGANRYDPKSDRWLRVSFFSGAPFLSNLNEQNVDSWGFATMSSYN